MKKAKLNTGSKKGDFKVEEESYEDETYEEK